VFDGTKNVFIEAFCANEEHEQVVMEAKKVYAYEKLVTSVTSLVINNLNGNNFSNRPVTTSNTVEMGHLT